MPITADTLKQLVRPVFVETGSYQGDGTAAALAAGFERVYTVEAHPPLFMAVRERFRDDPRVQCFLGLSIEALPGILDRLTEPATFWLDSHTCGPSTAGAWDTPLIGELRLIACHPIKQHVILIDDIHLCGLELPGMTELRERLDKINPEYQISFVQSAEPSLGLDILVAQP